MPRPGGASRGETEPADAGLRHFSGCWMRSPAFRHSGFSARERYGHGLPTTARATRPRLPVAAVRGRLSPSGTGHCSWPSVGATVHARPRPLGALIQAAAGSCRVAARSAADVTGTRREAESRAAARILGHPGAIAQLGERLLCKQEVTGSIPVGSIDSLGLAIWPQNPYLTGYRQQRCPAA